MNFQSPLLGALGGQAGDNSPVAWHYGDPLGEQRPSDRFFDLTHRTVISVTGKDAETYLTTLFSNLIDAHPAATWMLNLDAQGRILHLIAAVRAGQGEFLLLGPERGTQAAEELTTYLTRMVFWNDVTVQERPDLGALLRTGQHPLIATSGQLTGLNATLYLTPLEKLPELANQLIEQGSHPAGSLAYDAWRVANLWPEVGQDTTDASIPHEYPALITNAIHLTKGCYRGQETVARVENLGRSPKLGVRVLLDGSDPNLATTGTPITAAGREVGRLGTVVHDADYGPVGLATISRRALSQKQLQAGTTAISIDPASVPEEGAKPGLEAQKRLRPPVRENFSNGGRKTPGHAPGADI